MTDEHPEPPQRSAWRIVRGLLIAYAVILAILCVAAWAAATVWMSGFGSSPIPVYLPGGARTLIVVALAAALLLGYCLVTQDLGPVTSGLFAAGFVLLPGVFTFFYVFIYLAVVAPIALGVFTAIVVCHYVFLKPVGLIEAELDPYELLKD